MFRYKVSLGHVHDRIIVAEDGERLSLRVDCDSVDLVRLINRLEPKLNEIKDNTEAEQEIGSIAREFATAIFGEKQTNALFDMYNGNGTAVLSICTAYFSKRLGEKITKAQRRARL